MKTWTNTSAASGILKKTTVADRELNGALQLAPHLQCHSIDERQTLLASETSNTLLHGELHADLLPLLDGRRSQGDIVDVLSDKYFAPDICSTLVSLAAQGYVVSGDYAMSRAQAAFWSAQGASPAWAEARLRASGLTIAGDDGSLSRCLEALGVVVGQGKPTLSVVVCADYLDERHAAINQRRLASGAPWMLVRPQGMQALFGPIFRPAEQGPCWSCLAYRLRGHQDVHNFLRNRSGDGSGLFPEAFEPVLTDAVFGLVAAEIAKWLVFTETALLHDHAISLDMVKLHCRRHPTMRRPQCFACGDKALYKAERAPRPLRLQPSPKRVSNSGGQRSIPPEQTLARYRHLVSPVSGVVTWLERATDAGDAWLHVYSAGSNVALRSSELSSLRRGLRSKSAGKGSTREQAEASALCEAIERYSGAFHGDEIRRRMRLVDFVRTGAGEAIHPNDIQLFSERQLRHAGRNDGRDPAIPARFDPEAELDWTPVWSFTQERHRYIPTSLLYSMSVEQRGAADLVADSNGCASGNTLEEAILQGFYELVERDAFALWWYNRQCLPGLDLESLDDAYLAAAPDYYRGMGREMWLLDISADLGVPVFVALSRRIDAGAEDIIYGAGAHADPRIAALRALCEMNQCLTLVPRPNDADSRYAVDDPTCLSWWKNTRLEQQPWLAPAAGASLRSGADYPLPETTDTREDIERCRARVEAKNMEFLVLDQTRPDTAMPVARVIVPGLRHFRARFAPGRLYDAPVAMGRLDAPLAETELNPASVIA